MSYRGVPNFVQQELTSVRRLRESIEGGPGSGPRKGSGKSGEGQEKSVSTGTSNYRGRLGAISDDIAEKGHVTARHLDKLKSLANSVRANKNLGKQRYGFAEKIDSARISLQDKIPSSKWKTEAREYGVKGMKWGQGKKGQQDDRPADAPKALSRTNDVLDSHGAKKIEEFNKPYGVYRIKKLGKGHYIETNLDGSWDHFSGGGDTHNASGKGSKSLNSHLRSPKKSKPLFHPNRRMEGPLDNDD